MHENTELRREGNTHSRADCSTTTVSTPRYVVIPAGKAFFHVTEHATGRVRGFRCEHNQACALARYLES
ncbi:hypothetical protein N5D52_19615 [Pseudomonas sp. GD03860]|uniref:hypothetical protein n=1 Tax=Pseudomonas TaxID=286 RepID=UPI0023646CB7|nr:MULTISPECIES: hypothetical protein [Pseudomonas]MDD2061204.1 hypothetical protein [Pseudomonas putida]MDH0639149.1 hypothetical protein [Pseudomonas sp. GD03860]